MNANAEHPNPKPQSYIIVKAYDTDELSLAVSMCIKKGYRTNGSLVVIQKHRSEEYLQPMIYTE